MPNFTEFPTGKGLLDQLGDFYDLEEKIGLHTSLATEHGFPGGMVGVPDTHNRPGVTFRFYGSECANYCKVLKMPNGLIHIEFRYLVAKYDEPVTRRYFFVEPNRLKEIFSKATGLCLD